MAGYVDSGNAQASLGGISAAQRFMEMQMQQQQQGIQNTRQAMFDKVAMNQANREEAEYAQNQEHEKQMADVMRGYLNARFGFGGKDGQAGAVPQGGGAQQMAPEQMAMMEATRGDRPPPDPRNAKAEDVLPAMGVDPNLQPFQQRIKSIINNGDYKTLKALIPYVQDQDGFVKAQAIAHGVSSGKLFGNLLADKKDREFAEALALHSPESVMQFTGDLLKEQRQQRDRMDAAKQQNEYGVQADIRRHDNQISMAKLNNDYSIAGELRAREDATLRGQTAIEQQMYARKRNDEYESQQLGPAARMVNTEDMGNLDGPPSVDENALSTMRSLPPEMQARAIYGKFVARQEAGNRRGVAENLVGAGVDPATAAALAAASRNGQVPPSLLSSVANNKAEKAAAQRRVVEAAKVYRQTGEEVDKRMGKVMTIPGSENAPTKAEVEKARKGDKRATARIRAWNDLVQARQALEQTSGGLFSGVKQSSDVWDSLIDEAMGPTGGNEEINGMIQLGE